MILVTCILSSDVQSPVASLQTTKWWFIPCNNWVIGCCQYYCTVYDCEDDDIVTTLDTCADDKDYFLLSSWLSLSPSLWYTPDCGLFLTLSSVSLKTDSSETKDRVTQARAAAINVTLVWLLCSTSYNHSLNQSGMFCFQTQSNTMMEAWSVLWTCLWIVTRRIPSSSSYLKTVKPSITAAPCLWCGAGDTPARS